VPILFNVADVVLRNSRSARLSGQQAGVGGMPVRRSSRAASPWLSLPPGKLLMRRRSGTRHDRTSSGGAGARRSCIRGFDGDRLMLTCGVLYRAPEQEGLWSGSIAPAHYAYKAFNGCRPIGASEFTSAISLLCDKYFHGARLHAEVGSARYPLSTLPLPNSWEGAGSVRGIREVFWAPHFVQSPGLKKSVRVF